MVIQLVRKLANYLDGIDVSRSKQGDVIDLPRGEAELLIAERWAVPYFGPSMREVRGVSTRAALGLAADASPRRSLEQIRRIREALEERRSAAEQRRRAEDRIREELHDERAKTLNGKSRRASPGAGK